MSSLSTIIYNIRDLVRERSDDSRLSNAQLTHLVNTARATLIRRDYENKHTVNPQIIQSLGCLKLERVDKGECCDVGTGCYTLRTVRDIPPLLEVYKKNLITYVGSIDNETDFQTIPSIRTRWMKFGKYTKKIPTASLRGNKIYVNGDSLIDSITLRGVFEDPRVVANFSNCDGTTCFNPDSDTYPLPLWMEDAIFDMLRSSELDVYFKAQTDKENDSDDKRKPVNETLS